MSRDERELRAAVVEALGRDALSLDELRARLGPPWNRPSARDDLDHLLQYDTAFTRVLGGIAFVPALVEGTSWTVRIDPADAADGFVRTNPDLAALSWWLIGDEVGLVDAAGRRLGVVETDGWMLDGRDTDVVLGPDGWLDGLDGWARVDVVDGELRWSPLATPPSPTAAQLAAVRAGFEKAVRAAEQHRVLDRVPLPDGLEFGFEDDPIHEALLVDPIAFRSDPIPPLHDLYSAAGLVVHNRLVAAEDFDWDALREWQTRNGFARRYNLNAAEADLLAAVVAGLDESSDAELDPVLVEMALDDGAIADALWTEAPSAGLDLERLDQLLGESTAPRSIGRAWLHARVLDLDGDAVGAYELLEGVVDDRCRHEPALVDLAAFRADRGDAPGALRLLVQAGVQPDPDDEDAEDESPGALLWEEVAGFATHRPRPMARRNDPCPCGSGRKYKACHLGRETHALDDRAVWLYAKANRFLRTRRPGAVDELADLMSDDVDDAVVEALLEGPLLADVVLHEEGAFAEFVAARDALLPDDEALLAAQWSLVDRSVFEIVEVMRDQLLLRDVADGAEIRIVNTRPAGQTRPGTMMLGRPLPVGETYRAFSGFVPVTHGHLDAMLAAIDTRDSEAVVDALARIFAPPRLSNTDGEDMVLHTIRWHVRQPDAIGAALVGAGLGSVGDGEWTLVRDSRNQAGTVIARVWLEAGELVAEVNSAERAAEIRDLVATAIPDAVLGDVEVTPLDLRSRSGSPTAPSPWPPAPEDPALRQAMVDYIAQYERRWLDESIPALGGRTPRDAAADPIGREELRRLLASFPVPDPDDGTQMNPERLRAALGL